MGKLNKSDSMKMCKYENTQGLQKMIFIYSR